MVISVNANAQRARFTLTPTGTEVADYTEVLGEDRTPADGFRLLWRYPNQPIMGHLGIQATGPGGTTDETLSIVHAEP